MPSFLYLLDYSTIMTSYYVMLMWLPSYFIEKGMETDGMYITAALCLFYPLSSIFWPLVTSFIPERLLVGLCLLMVFLASLGMCFVEAKQ